MKKYIGVLMLCILFLTGCSIGKTGDKYTVDYVLKKCNLAGCDEFSEDGNTFTYQRRDEN